MRFIAHTLQKAQRIASFRQSQRRAVPGHIQLFVAFCQADNRNVQPERIEDALYRIHLSDAAVYHNEVGHFRLFV